MELYSFLHYGLGLRLLDGDEMMKPLYQVLLGFNSIPISVYNYFLNKKINIIRLISWKVKCKHTASETAF